MILSFVLLLAATFLFVVYAAIEENWVWILWGVLFQGALMVGFWLHMRRYPTVAQRHMDITTVVGLIAAFTLVALLTNTAPGEWSDSAWLFFVGAPICALLIGHPLHEAIAILTVLRLSILPPELVFKRLAATLAFQHGQAALDTLPSASSDELRRSRWELERGSHMLSSLGHYLLATAIVSCVMMLSGGMGELGASEWTTVLSQSLQPLAVGVAISLLICRPLQTKLDTYLRFLDDDQIGPQ